jgi:hypothetical protein
MQFWYTPEQQAANLAAWHEHTARREAQGAALAALKATLVPFRRAVNTACLAFNKGSERAWKDGSERILTAYKEAERLLDLAGDASEVGYHEPLLDEQAALLLREGVTSEDERAERTARIVALTERITAATAAYVAARKAANAVR